MRLAWSTDVHMNFLDDPGTARFVADLRAARADAVLLTGDISEAPHLPRHLDVLAAALRVPVYFVLGNHDYYRGQIAAVRAEARAITAGSPYLRWLPACGVVELTPGCALVGQDGWGDGRVGNAERSPILLADWALIEDLAAVHARFDVAARLVRLRALADADAAALRPDLDAALARYDRVLVLTHVPPYAGACWHEGALSNPDWLPWFTCVAVGEALDAAAARAPARAVDVYCGHTHSAGTYARRPGLVVHTGAAAYGAPVVTVVEVA